MEPLTTLQYWELASYVVTVVGLPMAIFIFAWEQWKDRENDEYEVGVTVVKADGKVTVTYAVREAGSE